MNCLCFANSNDRSGGYRVAMPAARHAVTKAVCLVAAFALGQRVVCGATFDVYRWETQTLVGQIDSFATAETGEQYYDYFSASGHPDDVNADDTHVNFWMHENTATPGIYSLGVIFGADATPGGSRTARSFVKVFSSATEAEMEFIDDPGAANDIVTEISKSRWETEFTYNANSDGFVVGDISGSNWTIAFGAESVVGADTMFAASGSMVGFGDDLLLDFLQEYRIVPQGSAPSAAPLIIPEPATSTSLCGLLCAYLAIGPRVLRNGSRPRESKDTS